MNKYVVKIQLTAVVSEGSHEVSQLIFIKTHSTYLNSVA